MSVDYRLLRGLIAKHAEGQREALRKSVFCACFSCLRRFHPTKAYSDFQDRTTAVCPYCYEPSVIGSATNLPLTVEALARLKRADAS